MPRPRITRTLVLSLGLACGGDPPAEGSAGTEVTTGDSTGPEAPTSGETGAGACVDGEVGCVGGSAQVCVDGVFAAPEVCAGACIDGVGCVTCEPASLVCDGDAVKLCGDDGEPGAVMAECDPVQGLSCAAGACTGACAADPMRAPEEGCEFWAAPLPALVDAAGGFGVAWTNTCEGAAALQIDAAGQPLLMLELAAGESRFVELPRLPPLYAATESVLTGNGAYRLRTDCPARAVQFSGGSGLASVDGSRLYPTERWGTEVRVVTQPSAMFEEAVEPVHGYFVVMARDDETTVTIDAPEGGVVGAVDVIPESGDGEITLDRGQVLLLISTLPHDLAGAHVTADRPIQVFGGHECSMVPLGTGFCDHLEEVMPPVAALGTDYVVMAPVASDGSGTAVPHRIRVVGTQDGTMVTTSDAMFGGLVDAGGVLELGPLGESIEISSDAPVLVAQFLVGVEADPLAADPSMLVPPPVDQHREEHALWTGEDWTLQVVQVVGPIGVTATLDGVDVDGWAMLAGANYVGASVVVDTPGAHALVADMPVGVSVIGLQSAPPVASYGYSGAWGL